MSTRDAIVDLARRQLGDGGWSHLNFKTIAAELDITRAAVHHHVDDKATLAAAALGDYVADSLDLMETVLEQVEHDLLAYVTTVEGYVVERLATGSNAPGCACAQVVDDTDAPDTLRVVATDYFERKHARIHEVVQRAADTGQLVDGADAGVVALLVTTHLLGTERLARLTTDPAGLSTAVKGSSEALLRPWLR